MEKQILFGLKLISTNKGDWKSIEKSKGMTNVAFIEEARDRHLMSNRRGRPYSNLRFINRRAFFFFFFSYFI